MTCRHSASSRCSIRTICMWIENRFAFPERSVSVAIAGARPGRAWPEQEVARRVNPHSLGIEPGIEAHEPDAFREPLATNITLLGQPHCFGDCGVGTGEQLFGLVDCVGHVAKLTWISQAPQRRLCRIWSHP